MGKEREDRGGGWRVILTEGEGEGWGGGQGDARGREREKIGKGKRGKNDRMGGRERGGENSGELDAG